MIPDIQYLFDADRGDPRNPSTPATGIATAGGSWILGAYHYGGTVEQTFHGWIGDVRVVDRPLQVVDFMPSRRPR